MFNVEVTAAPAAPAVTVDELRAHLRMNNTAEDDLLAEFLAAAEERFEDDTQRPVMQTVYRQSFSRWPVPHYWPAYAHPHTTPYSCRWPFGIVLARGGVSAVGSVKRYLADGTTEDVADWSADLQTPPARVMLAAIPDPLTTAAGVLVSPAGYVEYTAGWATAGAVPRTVRMAIKLLAAHWYDYREAYTEKNLNELSAGWCRVVSRYKLGLSGDWGQ